VSSFDLVIITVFLTLAFEFSSGWHDAANSIAMVVSTRVLTSSRRSMGRFRLLEFHYRFRFWNPRRLDHEQAWRISRW
jgi:hypothetical protein